MITVVNDNPIFVNNNELVFFGGIAKVAYELSYFLSKHEEVRLVSTSNEDLELSKGNLEVKLVKGRYTRSWHLPNPGLLKFAEGKLIVTTPLLLPFAKALFMAHHPGQVYYKPIKPFEDALYKLFGKNARAFVVPSPFMERFLRKLGIERVFVIGHGVDVEKYRFSKRKKEIAVIISRLVPHKRVDVALKILEPLDYEVFVIGDGLLKEKLESRFSWANFLGRIGEEEKINLLRKAKFLLTASELEGFGLTLIEALACGALPIASDIEAHRFVLKDLSDLLTFSSVEEAREKIRIIEENFSQFSERARAFVEKNWSWETIAPKYIELLEKLY